MNWVEDIVEFQHDILPLADPKSRVAKANLLQTCGSADCHTNVNKNFIKYLPHVNYTDPKSSMPVFIVWLVMNILLLGTLAVFIPHGILWLQRTLLERIGGSRDPQPPAHPEPQAGDGVQRRQTRPRAAQATAVTSNGGSGRSARHRSRSSSRSCGSSEATKDPAGPTPRVYGSHHSSNVA